MRRLISILAALVVGTSLAPAAHAAGTKVMFTQVTGAPISGTPSVAAGETLHFVLGNFPASGGLYIFQAVKPMVDGSKVTQFDQKGALMISNGSGANFTPAQVIALTINNGNSWGADCAHQQCGLWLEYNYEKPNDRSEDQFVPFTFSALPTAVATPGASAAPTMPATTETISVKINGMVAQVNTPGKISYREVLTFEATSGSGSPVTFKSYTPDLCPLTGNTVTALKGSGQCDIAATVGSKSSHFPFIVGPGVQNVKSSYSGKVGKSVALAKESNFGEMVSYSSKSAKICTVKGTTLKLNKKGNCLLEASAIGTDNYSALKTAIALSVK